ncbi:S-adenosylmethionine:tRNA ribosyltransferase-isomerase [Streptomyces sp. SID3343]|nr:S-adenosylmethionine:tRNA ribosyltransferase-isomerase [Streptomyces sp. SID3343]
MLAQEPPEARGGERSDVRLAVVDRGTGHVRHRVFRDVVDHTRPGDVLVVNNARFVPSLLEGGDRGRAGGGGELPLPASGPGPASPACTSPPATAFAPVTHC